MKKNLLIILSIFLVSSCSLFTGQNIDGGFSVDADAILSRVVIDENSPLIMKFRLDGGLNEYREAHGTHSQLKRTTFSFEKIKPGTSLNVSCAVLYDDGTPEGLEILRASGSNIIIKAGHNEIKLKMQKNFGGSGFSIVPIDQNAEISIVPKKSDKTLTAISNYTSYEWFIDGTSWGTSNPLNISTLAPGIHTVVVIADGSYSAMYTLTWEG